MQKIKGWLPAILATLLIVGDVVLNLLDVNSLILSYVIIALLLVQILLLYLQIHKAQDARPNLQFTKSKVKPLQMTEFHHKWNTDNNFFGGTATLSYAYLPTLRAYSSTGDYEQSTEPVSIALVYVENKKLENREITTSLNTHAKMFFYDEHMKPIHEDVDARWADTVEPSYSWLEPKERQYYLEKDIPAGVEQELCVVAKQKNDDNCFIFNLETYSENKLRRKEALLVKGKMFVKVVLRNANPLTADTWQWYELDNPGSGFDITITLTNKPLKV